MVFAFVLFRVSPGVSMLILSRRSTLQKIDSIELNVISVEWWNSQAESLTDRSEGWRLLTQQLLREIK